MLSSSYKMFWIMDCLRMYSGLSVENISYMHKLNTATYSRIITAIKNNEGKGLNGETDCHVQQTIRRLLKGYKAGILYPSTGKVSPMRLERLKLETGGIRFTSKKLERPPIAQVLLHASRI